MSACAGLLFCFAFALVLVLGRSHLISSIRQNATGMDRASVSGIVTAFDHKLFNDDTRIARIGRPLTPLCAPRTHARAARVCVRRGGRSRRVRHYAHQCSAMPSADGMPRDMGFPYG